MRIGLVFCLACLFGLGPAIPGARALQFSQTQVSGTEAILGGRGPIIEGDADRLQTALATCPGLRFGIPVRFLKCLGMPHEQTRSHFLFDWLQKTEHPLWHSGCPRT